MLGATHKADKSMKGKMNTKSGKASNLSYVRHYPPFKSPETFAELRAANMDWFNADEDIHRSSFESSLLEHLEKPILTRSATANTSHGQILDCAL